MLIAWSINWTIIYIVGTWMRVWVSMCVNGLILHIRFVETTSVYIISGLIHFLWEKMFKYAFSPWWLTELKGSSSMKCSVCDPDFVGWNPNQVRLGVHNPTHTYHHPEASEWSKPLCPKPHGSIHGKESKHCTLSATDHLAIPTCPFLNFRKSTPTYQIWVPLFSWTNDLSHWIPMALHGSYLMGKTCTCCSWPCYSERQPYTLALKLRKSGDGGYRPSVGLWLECKQPPSEALTSCKISRFQEKYQLLIKIWLATSRWANRLRTTTVASQLGWWSKPSCTILIQYLIQQRFIQEKFYCSYCSPEFCPVLLPKHPVMCDKSRGCMYYY